MAAEPVDRDDKVVGAITGGLIMGVINNGMSLIGAPSERVMLVREDGEPARSSWVAGLVTGDDERVHRAVTRVTALASVNADLVVTAHRLDGHPDGVLSGLRGLLDGS